MPTLCKERGATALALPFTDTIALHENSAYLPVVWNVYVRHWWRDDNERQGFSSFHGASIHRTDRQIFPLWQLGGLDIHAGGCVAGWEEAHWLGPNNFALSARRNSTCEKCFNLSKKIKMTMTGSIGKNMLLSGVLFMMAACGQNNASDAEPVNTKAYYVANPDKAKVVVDKCSALDKNELSLLSPSKRREWEDTNMGINCANAQLAYGDFVLMEYQRKLIQSDAKYGKPATSANK